jgi:hypothetical protein
MTAFESEPDSESEPEEEEEEEASENTCVVALGGAICEAFSGEATGTPT